MTPDLDALTMGCAFGLSSLFEGTCAAVIEKCFNFVSASEQSAVPDCEEDSVTVNSEVENSSGIATGVPPTPPSEYARSRTEQKFVHYQEECLSSSSSSSSSVVKTIVDISSIDNLLKFTCCPVCLEPGTLSTKQNRRYGLVVSLALFCSDCNDIVSGSVFTSEQLSTQNRGLSPFAVNRAATLASLQSGLGSHKFNVLSQYMNIPGLHHSTFGKLSFDFFRRNEELARRVFSSAVDVVISAYLSMGHELNDDGSLNISVSYDGSWLTCGHKSLIKIACVTDVLTGLVIDAHVMSQHCQRCSLLATKEDSHDPEEAEQLREQHSATDTCQKNFHGASGMMEVEGAEVMWQRSVPVNKLRYTTLVGDGDSKAFNRVHGLVLYGQDCPVTTEECPNHVSKRLGTALRNLVSD